MVLRVGQEQLSWKGVSVQKDLLSPPSNTSLSINKRNKKVPLFRFLKLPLKWKWLRGMCSPSFSSAPTRPDSDMCCFSSPSPRGGVRPPLGEQRQSGLIEGLLGHSYGQRGHIPGLPCNPGFSRSGQDAATQCHRGGLPRPDPWTILSVVYEVKGWRPDD